MMAHGGGLANLAVSLSCWALTCMTALCDAETAKTEKNLPLATKAAVIAYDPVPVREVAAELGAKIHSELGDKKVIGRIDSASDLAWMLDARYAEREGSTYIGGGGRNLTAVPNPSLADGQLQEARAVGDLLLIESQHPSELATLIDVVTQLSTPDTARATVYAVEVTKEHAEDLGIDVTGGIGGNIRNLSLNGAVNLDLAVLSDKLRASGSSGLMQEVLIMSGRSVTASIEEVQYEDRVVVSEGGVVQTARNADSRRQGLRLEVLLYSIGDRWLGTLSFRDGRRISETVDSQAEYQIPVTIGAGEVVETMYHRRTQAESTRKKYWIFPRKSSGSVDRYLVIGIRIHK